MSSVRWRLVAHTLGIAGQWLRWTNDAVALQCLPGPRLHGSVGRTPCTTGPAAPYGLLVPIVPPRHQAAVASLRPVDTRALVENTS